MIDVKTTFTRQDIKDAIELHYNYKFPFRSKLMLVGGFLMLIVGISILIFNWPPEYPYLKYLFIFMGIFYMGFYFYKKKNMLDRAAKNSNLVTDHQITVGKKAITFNGEKGKSVRLWSQIEDSAEDEKMMLYYFTIDQFYILPKRAFSAEQIEEIKNFGKQKKAKNEK